MRERDSATDATGPPGEDPAPEVVAPPPGHPRFPLFDSMRALAALSILLVHTALASGAFDDRFYGPLLAHLDIGVTVFFLLSGFLLYRPFVASGVLGARSVRVRDYAKRRFLRIAPAYWLALTVLAVFPGLRGVFTGDWWVYYGLLQNYPVYTQSPECVTDLFLFRCGIAPSWTLAVEVGFYALLPLFALALGALRRRAGRRWPLLEAFALLGVSAISILIMAGEVGSGDAATWLFYSPLGRGLWFALGMGLAVVSVRSQESGRAPAVVGRMADRPGLVWLSAIGLYVLASLAWLEPAPTLGAPVGISVAEFVAEFVLFGLISLLLLLPAVFGDRERSLPRRFLASRALSWLGLVSYGIFLWHYPVMLGLHDADVQGWWPEMAFPVLSALTLAITVICAAASYYLVERPLMRLK